MTRAVAALPTPPARDLETFVLPHNLEAERATLGAALVQASAADYICDRLQPATYFRRAHQAIFRAIGRLRAQRTAVDFLTLKAALTASGELEEVGGPGYLVALTDGLPHSTNVAHYAAILRDLQAKRTLVGFATRTLDLVASGSHSGAAILRDADRRLMELQAGYVEGRMLPVADTLADLSSDIEWRMSHRGELTGITTGYDSVNALTLGWQRSDLIIVAARPSIGKTTFVLNCGVHAAQAGRRVAVFSLEMRRRQLEYRMVSQLSGVPLTRILNGYLGDPELPRMATAMLALGNLPIQIDDRAGQTVWDIRAACRRLQAEAGLDLVVIDYVQLIPGTLDRRGATRNEELTDVSRRLKELADEVSAPILLLSQLSRKNQERTDPTPKLSDLRESGALEQDADLVCFLHRKSHRESGTTTLILEKARNGPTGTVNLTLDRDIVTFTDGGAEPPPAADVDHKPRRRKHS